VITLNEELRNLNDEKQTAMDGSSATISDAAGFIHVKFQLGPVKEKGVNGTSIENVIDLLIRRLNGFQAGPFSCPSNALAIAKLHEAIEALESRTKKRVEQGVEGTNQSHKE
jgi:hypothetical protein